LKYYVEEKAGELRRKLEEKVLNWPDVTAKKMFGSPSYFVKGKLFAFVITEGVVITNLRKEEREKIPTSHQTSPFTAYGKTMKKWVKLETDADNLESIIPYIAKSYEKSSSSK
jgi:hypothetical protein